MKSPRTVSAMHCSLSFKDIVGRGSVFHPQKKRKDGGISQPPETGKEIVIQQASDSCQAVLLHCRCDANVHSSFSSLRCVILLLAFTSFTLSFPSSSSFPFLVLPAVFSLCMPPLTLRAFLCLSLSLHSLFTAFIQIALCSPTSLFSPPFFFYLSSQRR